MADGGTKGAFVEAVVKPVADEIGKALEQGAQAIAGKTPTTQQIQQKQMQDQKDIADTQRKIDYWKQIAQAQAQVRQVKKQEDVEKNQEKKEEAKIKQYEIVEKKQDSEQREDMARTQGERRAGRGMGG